MTGLLCEAAGAAPSFSMNDGDLAIPVACNESGGGEDHHREKRGDDDHRHHGDAIGSQAPPREDPEPG
jgi:hypothetical protein